MSALAVPTLHLNGTGKAGLIDPLLEARSAVMVATAAVRNAGPNQRDYYLQGDEAWRQAVEQHGARLDRLIDIDNELYRLIEAIMDGGHKR